MNVYSIPRNALSPQRFDMIRADLPSRPADFRQSFPVWIAAAIIAPANRAKAKRRVA